jgi:hypothetical protein
MAYSRGRLSKRQKRRSLKRKNVKSRKVMRGGRQCTYKGTNWLRANWAKMTPIEKTQILVGMNATKESSHENTVEEIIKMNDCT